MSKSIIAVFILLLLLISACSVPETIISAEAADISVAESGVEESCSGSDCEEIEEAIECVENCGEADDQTSALPNEDGVLWVSNPTSGADLYVQIFTPDDGDENALSTLVLVPGGFGNSSDFTGDRRSAQSFADEGFTIVVFDPDGRGNSAGEEDKNGFIHQDGLAEIISIISKLPQVDASAIGLISYSYGVTMATGTLARYPDLPVLFYIDWEGPADRAYTTHDCSADAPGIGSTRVMAPCDDESFWSEREGTTFIAQISMPYLRIQFQRDHAQDVVTHAVDMVNAAVNGTASWVRLNDLTANESYDPLSPPRMIPGKGSNKLDKVMPEYAIEMFGLFTP